MRKEKDSLGEMQLDENALYGIHAARARNNFPDNTRFHIEWYKALALVKKACYQTARDFIEKAGEKADLGALKIRLPEAKILDTYIASADECITGKHFDHFIVPAVSGGAGTSINMNLNEILTNLSLRSLKFKPGEYQYADPVEDANIFQSTNDVVPTSLHVAAIHLLNELEEEINLLRAEAEKLEKEHRNTLRPGYTQMQEAVPTTYGRLFSTYADALSRDWWRISKCLERIKVVNLGGSAIGTSIAVPKYYSLEVVKTLQRISGLPVTRAENLADATSNLDPVSEVHGILRTHAVNLEKMVNDLRLLASGINPNKELYLPKKQVGSSIMPGKVNPVIPEFVISSAHRIYANDQLISSLCAQGCLELNAYLPVIGHALIESLKLLIACNRSCRSNLLKGITIDAEKASEHLFRSPSMATALLPYIGYNNATELAVYMKENNVDIFQANQDMNLIEEAKLRKILKPGNLVQGGYRLDDLGENQS